VAEEVEFCKRVVGLLRQQGECGSYAPDTMECKALKAIQSPDRAAACMALSAEPGSPMRPEACPFLAKMEENDCNMIPMLIRKAKGDKPETHPTEVCEVVRALKSGVKSCDGLFASNSNPCGLLVMLQAAVSGDRTLCASLEEQRFKDRCRSFLSTRLDDCEERSSKEWGTGQRDDGPCRKMRWEKTILPASEGRTELRLTFMNEFDSPATCSVLVQVAGKESTTTQKLSVAVGGAKKAVKSLFFVAEEGSTYEATPECTWDRSKESPPPAR